MLAINQFDLNHTVFEHYEDKQIYVVRTIITHRRHSKGLWIPMPDPMVAYEHLEVQYAENPKNPGSKTMVQKGFSMKLSEFKGMVKDDKGDTVRRFKPV